MAIDVANLELVVATAADRSRAENLIASMIQQFELSGSTVEARVERLVIDLSAGTWTTGETLARSVSERIGAAEHFSSGKGE